MRKLLPIAFLVSLLAPAAASAQLTLGARVGYAFPTGKVDDGPDADLGDYWKNQIPLQVDVGFKLSPALTLGGYVSYGFSSAGDVADAELCSLTDVDCSLSIVRLGVQLDYAFETASPSVVPWFGVGTGYEWARIKADGPVGEAKLTDKGWEILNLQVGADFKAGPSFAVGPFAQYAFGKYTRIELEDEDGNTLGGDVEDTAMHGWFQIGVRGRFGL